MLESRYSLKLDDRQFVRGSKRSANRFKRDMGDIKGSINGLGSTFSRETQQIDFAATRTSGKLATLAKRGTLLATALAIAGTAKKAITDYGDFEAGLIGVGKTADIEGAKLSAFGDDIQKLSREIPVPTDQLLELAGAAGQLGVKGTKNILAFTKIMAELEASSDVQGEQGAKDIVRLLNITKEGITEANRFTNTLVALGNDAAASESEILDVATRVAQSTAAFDLGSTAILGYSAGLKSLGVTAEVAGSTTLTAFVAIKDAIDEGGQGLSALEQLTGKTADQLKTLFAEDQAQLLQLFIKGLNGVKESGGDVLGTLKELGIVEKRAVATLGTAAKGYDTLAESIDLAKKAAAENKARAEEAEKTYKLLNAQIVRTKNSMKFASQEIGKFIEPGVVSALGDVASLFNGIGDAIEYVNKGIENSGIPDYGPLEKQLEANKKSFDGLVSDSLKFAATSFFGRNGFLGDAAGTKDPSKQIIGTTRTLIDLSANLAKQAELTGKALALSFQTQATVVSKSIKSQIGNIDTQISKFQEAADKAKGFREELEEAIKQNNAGPEPTKATAATDAIVKTRSASTGDDPERTLELGREALAIITQLRDDGVIDERLAGAQLLQLKKITEKAAADIQAQSQNAIALLTAEAAELKSIQVGIDKASAERAAKGLKTTFEKALSSLRLDASNLNLNGNPNNPANFDPRNNVIQDLTRSKVPAQPGINAKANAPQSAKLDVKVSADQSLQSISRQLEQTLKINATKLVEDSVKQIFSSEASRVN